MRLNDDKLGLLCSQEDLANYACMKKQESREDVSSAEAGGVVGGGVGGGALLPDYAIESPVATAPHHLMLTKQNSFEHDESLGILTPDQMTDFTVALESSRTPSCENLSGYANSGKFLGGKNNSVLSGNRHLDIAACLPSIEALIPSHDRSPSLEELPLDPKPGVIIVDEEIDLLDATLSNEADKCIESPLHRALNGAELSPKKVVIDSTETSEHTSEPTTRCSVSSGHTLPTSFITSVTSITSLEAGYQGDGENSRPASRGAEPLSVAPPASLIVSAACRQDPMTDSDFFTESDADAHEEIVRGDRRAQVIDGTLFCVPNERRCASFEPGEEMDSSGIYSDIDKRLDSIGVDAEGYGDGDHTTDTGDTGDTEISMKSQPSPREKTPVTPLASKNILSPQSVLNDTMESTASTAEVTVIKCQKNEQNTATKSKSSSVSNKENSAPLKKYKMPKRNVISKIKTMIESNQNIAKEESENEPRRLQRQQRKNGRWDAVMNKIEAGKQRGRSLKKEVKSRVLQNLGTSSSSTASTSSTRRSPGDNNNNANNSKDKRRIRGRPDTNSPNQETARSSVRSSASDLSSANSKETLKRPLRKNCVDAHQPNNNQLNGNINKTNLSTVRKAPSIKSVQSNVNAKQKNATTNKVADRNNASNNRTTGPVGPAGAGVVGKDSPPAPVLNNQVVLNNNNNNHNNHSNHNHHHHHHISNNNNNATSNIINHAAAGEPLATSPAPAGKDTREQESQVDLLPAAAAEEEPSVKQLEPGWAKRAEDTVQALAVTVQYFTRQLENNPSDRLRNELERMRSELLATKSELEDLGLRKTSVEDALNQERAEHIQALENLHEALKRQQASLEQSLLEERRRADGLEEREREYKAALELALSRQQQLPQLQQQQVAPEQTALLAEVESLRTVMELRSQESAQLRSEVDLLRRELDEKETMRQRCEALEARCEDLKAQLDSKESFERQLAHDNEVLMGSIHQLSKQNKRLSQRNEELLWRLRQKNEVVSVLTNQLTPQSQRLSKSLGPSEHSETTESSCSQKSEQSCSIVKYMVEKGDSVSWTLDITESMETSSGSVTGDTKASTPNSARRFREASGSAGGLVARQSSLRLSMPRRSTAPTSSGSLSSRARSNSVSVVPESATPAARPSTAPGDEQVWSPNCSSTPLQRRRNVAANATPVPEQTWSLSSAVAETLSTSSNSSGVSNGGAATLGGPVAKGSGPLETSTTDEDEEEEEEEVGQRPQEAGGEAMISEETSASSSSSEEDESSVSSGDIP